MHFCFIKSNIFPSPDWNRSSYSINVGGKNAFDILHHVSMRITFKTQTNNFWKVFIVKKKWEAIASIARRTVGRNVNKPPKIRLKKSLNWRIILVPATVWQRGYQIGNTKIDLGGDLPVFEIETWNFQQMLDLGFSETWQNFSSFRQRFFHSFKEGTKGKMLRNCPNYTLLFEFFSFGNYEKKCLKELKFCEVSGNPKSSINDRE